MAWTIPRSLKQLRGFLALTGYYRHFVKNYGIIARPLTDLLKKDHLCSTSDTQEAFAKLKLALTKILVMILLDLHN